MSLAAADLLVGVIVLPTCMYTLIAIVGTQLHTDVKRSVKGYQLVNESYVEAEAFISEGIHEILRRDALPIAYLDTVGFVTTISIFVSVYTLAGAGFDRFSAVHRPLAYDKTRAKRIAQITSICSWIVAAVVSALPLFTPPDILSYGVNFSLIVATLRLSGIILYVIVFFIPLIAVWAVNISVYVVIKTHNKLQRRVSRCSRPKAEEVEKKLASTLRLMVGVFTFNTLPLWITLLCYFFVPNSRIEFPETLNTKVVSIFITVQAVSALLLLGNSLCNFFIYNSRSEEFRKTFKETILDKIGLTTCWTKVYPLLRNAKGESRRRLSSVSLNVFNLHTKKSSHTEETGLPSHIRKSDNSSIKSAQGERSSSSAAPTSPCRERSTSSEKEDLVLQSLSHSEHDNHSQSSVIRRLNETLAQDSANKPKIIYK